MNTILQKRIEEAAKTLITYNLVDLGDLVNQYDLRRMLIEMGIKTLQNQWVSVEEVLPKDFEKVFFRAVGKNDSVCYGTGYINIDDWYTDIQHIEQDYFKFKITHWMSIPSLKGGEK